MLQRFGSWLMRGLRMIGIAILAVFLIICLSALSEASRPPERPTYIRDARTNTCFAVFERKDGKEHIPVSCSPEVLRLVR